jgi:hypothetical protein
MLIVVACLQCFPVCAKSALGTARALENVEKDRGFENPEGSVEGYGRVGVRVGIFQPSTYPYPSRGSRGYRGYRRGR